jgi:hypothetical protein
MPHQRVALNLTDTHSSRAAGIFTSGAGGSIAATSSSSIIAADRIRPHSGVKRHGEFMSTRSSTTLADLFKLHVRAGPFSAVRASLRRQSSDYLDDGVTDGRQAWLRRRSVDSFFPASLF